MVFDIIGNIHRYMALNNHFSKAVEFVLRSDLMELPVGKYEIDGEHVYAMVSRDAGRKKKDAQLEIHRKYIDIQLVLEGTDEMGWRSAASCRKLSSEFDKESDIQFYSDEPDIWIPVKQGLFVIFFPEDAHMPLISEGQLHKIVVKISVD